MRKFGRGILALGIGVAFLAAPSIAFGDGLQFSATLSGAQVVPEVVTGTTGEISVELDDDLSKVEVKLEVRDGTATTKAHFHCGLAGVNAPVPFGLFVPGPLSFDGEKAEGFLVNADFTGADCIPIIARPVNNIAALAFAMRDGLIYAQTHSDTNPDGEIRGQLLEADDDDDGDDDDD